MQNAGLSFASRQGMQANTQHGSRWVTAFTGPLAPIGCKDDGTRYNPRISTEVWSEHQPRLEELHKQKRTRDEMREILQKECGSSDCTFRPSTAQLNRKMQKWGFSKPNRTIESQNTSPELPGVEDQHGLPQDVFPDNRSHFSHEDHMHATGVVSFSSPRAPEPIELPELCSDVEDSSADDYMSSPVLLQSDITCAPIPVGQCSAINLNVRDIAPFHEVTAYCEDTCCKTLLQIHKKLMAVSFLAGLKCWRDAGRYLSKIVAGLDFDSNISASDKMWVKLVNNRFKGNLFTPDRDTGIFLGEDLRNISEPLNKYINQAESQIVPSGLAILCLTTQYRWSGSFEYYVLAAENCQSTDDQIRVLSAELAAVEMQTSVLRGILFWCNTILAQPISRDMVEMLPQNLEHTDSLREIALPRLLACRFMSSWVNDPPRELLEILTSLKPRYGALFVPEVMLPEIFIAISHLILRHTKQFPMLSASTFVDGLLRAVQSATAKACQMRVERYCSEIAQILISMCDQSSAVPQAGCRHSEFVAMQVAHEMMGTNGMSAQGLEHHFTWTRAADIFKVNSFYHCSDSILTPNYASIDPADLMITNGETFQDRHATLDDLADLDPGSHMHIKNKSSSSTIENLIEESYQTLMSDVKNHSADDTETVFRDMRSGIPRRFPTNSTERELWNIRARAAAERMRNNLVNMPIRASSKTSSGHSRMSVAASIIPERASYYGGDEQLFVSDVGQSIMQVLNSTSDAQTVDRLIDLPDPRSHAYNLEQDPHVYRWVRNQNAPMSLGRSTSAA